MQPHAYLYELEFQNTFSDLYSISTGHGFYKKQKGLVESPSLVLLINDTKLLMPCV